MARKRINLLPIDERKRMALSYDNALIAMGVFLTLICALHGYSTQQELSKSELALAAVKIKHDTLSAQVVSTKPVKASKSLKGEAVVVPVSLEDVLKNKSVWSEPLRELSGLVPSGVWLSDLSAGYDKNGRRIMSLKGSAPSGQRISEFYGLLERSYYYRNVMMKVSERQKDAAPELYNFEFSSPMKIESKVVSNATR